MKNQLPTLLSNTQTIKHTLLLLLLNFTTLFVSASTPDVPSYSANPVKGKITDSRGMPVVGANVAVKGSSTATSTDKDGNFELTAAVGDILIISYVGFKKKEVVATATPLSISLEEDAETLNEVSVIGSRGKPRTDVNRPVPVDVLTAKVLQNTNQIELGQQLQFASPSDRKSVV